MYLVLFTSAVKPRLIAFKIKIVYIICVRTMYIYYVYINTHMHVYI